MAGYKCVNFVDLCRLCASSGGGRTGIFSEEGKRKNILFKITDCLKIKVYEKDRLPKSVCAKCLKQLEAHVEFRDSVVKAQGMLESCLNSTKLRNGGMVYIKDDTVKDDQMVTQMSTAPSPVTATITLPTLQAQPSPAPSAPQLKLVPAISASSAASQHQTATITTAPAMTPIIINSLPKGFSQTTSSGSAGSLPTATIMAPNADFLSSIMQAVGIQTADAQQQQQQQQQQQNQQQQQQQQQQQPLAQYTITLDGQTIKANQIHYKIQDGTNQAVLTTGGDPEQQSSYQQMDEFLKLKTPVKMSRRESEKTPEAVAAKKPKISVLIKSPPTPQATLVTSTPPKQTILASTAPVAVVSSSPITLTPVSSTSSIASFTNAPPGTIFTSTPIASSSTVTTPVKSSAMSVLDAKMMQGQKCIVPIMLKAEGGGEQIALAPIANVADMNKGMVQNVQYVQMKLQPGPDGMFRLAPTQMPPALTLTPQGLQQFGIGPLQTVQSQPAQQQQHHQQIQIQPQHIQAQLAVPSVQVPLSNYLSLVEKSSQLQNAASELQSQQANIVITTQPVQQQPQQHHQQQQQIQQPTQHMQLVQRPTVQVQAPPPSHQPPPKPQKPNPPQPPPPPATSRREASSQEDHLNSSSESNPSISRASQTAQSIAATQQMKAISALSLKQDGHQNDHLSSTTAGGKNATPSSSSTVSFTSCDVCSKSFKRKEHLMQHLKSHVGLRPFKCDEAGCSKSFSRKEHLMRHIVSHTGKKMFACPICRKYFSRKDNLNKHKKTHQENSSSAPYHCSICSKHFYIKGQFLRHKQMHDMAVAAADSQKTQKKSPVKMKTEPPDTTQPLPMLQQTQHQQIQQVQLPTQQQQQQQHQQQQHHHQQPQQHQQLTPVSIQSQQIFTIPAQLHNSIPGKGPIIHQLQIAMPTSSAQQSTIHTVSGSGSTMASLAGLGGGGGGGGLVTGSGATKTAIIKSADGSSATVYTIPSNFIIDGSQFLGAMQQSRELMSNIKIEQIT